MSSRPAPAFLVGPGTAARGLGALQAYFDGVRQGDGAAFLVATALCPGDERRLVEMLRRGLSLPVVYVVEGTLAEPGHAYVVPAGYTPRAEAGEFALEPTPGPVARHHAGRFLRALANAWGPRAAGVVLLPSSEDTAAVPPVAEMSPEELRDEVERLRATNEDLHRRVAAVNVARRDLYNLIAASEVPALFLDRDLRVRRFTPRVSDHFDLGPDDAGRPLAELTPRFEGTRLEPDVRAVLDDAEVRQREVRNEDGRWHLIHLLPYCDLDGNAGAVLTFADITRQKQQEEELRAATEQFSALVDASAQMVWQTDQEGKLQAPSRSWGAFTGQAAEDQIGYGWSDCVHPDDRARIMQEWEASVQEGVLFDSDFRLWHGASRAWRWVTTRGVPLHGEDGALRGYVGMNVDVTELREAKEQVEQQLHTFGSALGSFEDFVYVFDLDGRFTYVNRPLLDLWEVTAEEAFGKTFAEIGYPPHLVELHHHQIEEVIRTATPIRAGNAYVSPGGVEGLYEYIFTPVLDADGAVVAVAGVTRDVTEPRRAEAALRSSEERLRQALAVADMGTWVHEFAEGVTRFDERARAIFGLQEEALRVPDVPAHVHPEDLERFARQHATEASNAPRIFTATHRVVRADGSVRWVRGQTRVFYEPAAAELPQPVRAIGVVVDVTEQQQAEEEIRRLNATLENRVASRTAQVRQLNTLLASAEQEERRRIAHILHDDLQQQLAGLAITLALLRDTDGDAEAALRDHAEGIIERSLSLTRSLAAELSPPVLSDTRLAPLLHWLAERHQTLHRLDVSVDVEEPCVVEDYDVRALLYHSLREVLFNVVKHADTSSARLRAYSSGPYAVVEVSDEGIGFSAGEEDHAPASSGFGLASVRERLRLAEGSLEVESAPGRGTRAILRVRTSARPDGSVLGP